MTEMSFAEINDEFPFEWETSKTLPSLSECVIECKEGKLRLLADEETNEGCVTVYLHDEFNYEGSWMKAFKSFSKAKSWCIEKAKELSFQYKS